MSSIRPASVPDPGTNTIVPPFAATLRPFERGNVAKNKNPSGAPAGIVAVPSCATGDQ